MLIIHKLLLLLCVVIVRGTCPDNFLTATIFSQPSFPLKRVCGAYAFHVSIQLVVPFKFAGEWREGGREGGREKGREGGREGEGKGKWIERWWSRSRWR